MCPCHPRRTLIKTYAIQTIPIFQFTKKSETTGGMTTTGSIQPRQWKARFTMSFIVYNLPLGSVACTHTHVVFAAIDVHPRVRVTRTITRHPVVPVLRLHHLPARQTPNLGHVGHSPMRRWRCPSHSLILIAGRWRGRRRV